MFQSLKVNKKQSIWTEYLSEQKKEIKFKCKKYGTINTQYTTYVNRPKKIVKGDFAKSQGGLSKLSPQKSDGFWDSKKRSWTSWKAAKGTQN